MQSLPDLYDAPAEALRGAAEGAQGDTVMVIAHNPGIGVLAQTLARSCIAVGVEERAAIEQGFPTATAAAFEFLHGRTACLGVFRPEPA